MDHFVRPGLRFDVVDRALRRAGRGAAARVPAAAVQLRGRRQPAERGRAANAYADSTRLHARRATDPAAGLPNRGDLPPMSSPCWTPPALPKPTSLVMTGAATRPGGRPAGMQIGSPR